MCRAVTCTTCGRTTWAGCGQHVDAVMRDVPKAQRCAGHESSSRATSSGTSPSTASGKAPGTLSTGDRPTRGSFLARLLGR
ncbi:hypothetical protein GCM10025865_13430 [Paraoerskovia sediminicola]|uniref:Uncharacterized protein n=1 Tax=Paraoerskovia sediminicola TaxID=1138587 RepID=A0ABM8G1Q1_9CELL|nr:hypothetical protein GCM10025865_13430 [Paraoerskovia sediminicola]